jgi:hypothetical protein
VALVLAIEPDLRQAEILTRIVREKVKADVVIVDSRDAAMEAMRSAVPDVMLLSALLSPRDEDELVAHLRTLDAAAHLQTHTIPQLASAGSAGEAGPARGLLKAFRRKKDTQPAVAGCDPELFAEEIRAFLQQAEEKRREHAEELKYRPASTPKPSAAPQSKSAGDAEQMPPSATASWDSPFEWRRTDTAPAPLSSFEEEPATAFSFQPPPAAPAAPPLDDFDARPLQPSSMDDAAPLPPIEPMMATDRLLASHEEETPASSIDVVDTPPQEIADPIGAPELFETFIPPAPVMEQALAAQPEPSLPEPSLPECELFASEPQVVEPASQVATAEPEPIEYEPRVGAAQTEPVVVPDFDFAHFAVESLPVEAVQVEPPQTAAVDVEPTIPTPEEIEAFGRALAPEFQFAMPRVEPVPAPDTPLVQVADDLEDLLALEGFAGVEPEIVELPAEEIADAVHAAATADARVQAEEEIDLEWTDVNLAAAATEEVDEEIEQAEEPPPAPKKLPPSLGPLATWARVERKEEERRPGSDMREIISRLAVPLNIAGVSYARGVRIRRVRVAGRRDRRRPTDNTGPLILSRRALEETRTNA